MKAVTILTHFADNGGRKGHTMHTANKAQDVQTTISLPANLANMLEKEARARRKSIAAMMAEWLHEQAEDRAARKSLEKAIKANKGKPSIKAEDLYAQCGL